MRNFNFDLTLVGVKQRKLLLRLILAAQQDFLKIVMEHRYVISCAYPSIVSSEQ